MRNSAIIKCPFSIKNVQHRGTRLAPSVEHSTLVLRFMSLSPTLGVELFFVFFLMCIIVSAGTLWCQEAIIPACTVMPDLI